MVKVCKSKNIGTAALYVAFIFAFSTPFQKNGLGTQNLYILSNTSISLKKAIASLWEHYLFIHQKPLMLMLYKLEKHQEQQMNNQKHYFNHNYKKRKKPKQKSKSRPTTAKGSGSSWEACLMQSGKGNTFFLSLVQIYCQWHRSPDKHHSLLLCTLLYSYAPLPPIYFLFFLCSLFIPTYVWVFSKFKRRRSFSSAGMFPPSFI